MGAAYVEERQRLILTRVRWTALGALVPIAFSAVLNVLVFTDRLPERLTSFALEAGICLATLLATRGRAAQRRAILIAAAMVLGIETVSLWALSLSPADLDILTGTISGTMVASTLVFPWGVVAQAVVSTYLAVGYLLLLPWELLPAARLANVVITLFLGLSTAVVGAALFDRQRRATFAERERVAALARQRELLLEAGRELNGTLALRVLVERVTELARRLVGCDAVALTVLDPRRQIFRPVASTAAHPHANDDIFAVDVPAENMRFLTDAMLREGVLELPGGTPLDAVQTFAAQRFGLQRTLFVPIQHDGNLLAFLSLNQYALMPPFGQDRIRLAEGIAQQAATALANARLVEDLQAASRAKSEFVSTMSHELRTPLHVIMGYTDMLEDTEGEERATAVARVRHASRELLDLIGATLDLGRMEAGQDPPAFAPVAVDELLGELADEFAALPRPADVALRWEAVNQVRLNTDRRKLKTIIKNLVGNALKFTASGEIVVSCAPDEAGCALAVRDTGVGIDAEHLPLIFEMFRQVDSSDSRSYAGAGLGLYIVRRLLDQLRGEISVESTPGRGSTFTVTLPTA